MQKFFYKRSKVWDYIMLVIGTGLVATSIQCIYDPISLVTGGFSGLAIIVKAVTAEVVPGGVPLWLTNIALNVPVFLVALKVKGKRFIGRTLVGTFLLSAWLYVIPPIDLTQGDYILAAVFGGVIGGVGMGLVLLAKATTGGTDMVATLIQHYVRHYSIVQILQILDALVVLCGFYVFGIRAALYAIVAIFITSKVSDTLMEGFKFSKAAFIITDKYEMVAKHILEDLDRGVTGLMAKGMYSGADKFMLYCVVSQKEIVQVKEIVAEIDPNAFVIVSDAREVLGEGFLEYSK
ncbi:MAG: YitT family protein [Clostridiales bacterium]|nr:YitT family protein [Roseburia sp.]MDD7636503.1 YitT family protein [Clostridiales bacterium]MDY4112189.1 YitT family protein [Roseburia sp.]